MFDAGRYRDAGVVAVCARIGDLDHPVNFGRVVHFVPDTDYGREMRSRFWLGEIEAAIPTSDEQTRAMRQSNVNEELARRLQNGLSRGNVADAVPAVHAGQYIIF